ncbi:MAG: hypothetical protein ABIK07_26190 [Planctomycetota bacterium]
MSVILQEKMDTISLRTLDQEHENLRKEVFQNLPVLLENPVKQEDFIRQVDTFLDRLRSWSSQSQTTTAVNSVNRMASEWQMIFTRELRIPKNIYEILKIQVDPDICEPMLSDSASPLLSHEQIVERIRHRAYQISKDWKINWIKRLFYALREHPERVHENALRLPERTPGDDWQDACTCLACDVLDSHIDLTVQVGVESFQFLENVWLEDVKRLKAYLHWEATEPEGRLDDPQRHYDLAFQEIHKQLLNPSIKSGPESFLPIKNWLSNVVLDNGQVNTKTRPYSHSLIEKKAQRLWDRTKSGDPETHWLHAESYVQKFYENLIPAVEKQDQKAIETILEATAVSPQSPQTSEIVNALEVALVTYFFQPTLMQPFFDHHTTYL